MPRRGFRSADLEASEYEWLATYKIGKVITSKFNLEDALSLIADIACAVTESDAASITMADIDTRRLVVAGSSGIDKNLAAKGPLKFERAVAENLVSSKKAFSIGNIKNASKFRYPELLNEKHFSSVLCVPAIFNHRFLASMVLYSKQPHIYTKRQIRISSALAYQIALAIQNYHLYANMHMNYFNTIKSLVLAMEAKDPYTKGHSERVTEYALTIANNIGLESWQVQMIKYCGMLHDLGKIAIPDAILNKPAPLLPSEKNLIQEHPGRGAQMLEPLAFLRQGIPLVRHHHERVDGTGYPDGLRLDKIPIIARVLTCADAYDAMTSDRPYRAKLTKEMAVKELNNNTEKQFDSNVTKVFLNILEGK